MASLRACRRKTGPGSERCNLCFAFFSGWAEELLDDNEAPARVSRAADSSADARLTALSRDFLSLFQASDH